MEHFTQAEAIVTISDDNKCRHIKDDGDRCGQVVGSEVDYCIWHDPDRQGEAEAARERGGYSGSTRRKKYIRGTLVDVDSAGDIVDELREVAANLKTLYLTPAVANSLIRCYQVMLNAKLEIKEQEELREEIDELKESMGLE